MQPFKLLDMFEVFLRNAKENEMLLSDLDSKNGDGDLGITYNKAMTSIVDSLKGQNDVEDIGKSLIEGGMEIYENAASTMGTLIASGITQAGKELKGRKKIEKEEIELFLNGLIIGIQKRGKAKQGDKTILDVLIPSYEYVKNSSETNLHILIVETVKVAKAAVEETKNLKAIHGRAARYENQSQGLLDPGSVVGLIMIKSIGEYFENSMLDG